MRATKRRDTRPELRIRSLLHRRGFRFRVDYPAQTATRAPRLDIAFTRCKVGIFIDGCFWHLCPAHCRMPTRNREYWETKLEGNALRDRVVDSELAEAGWLVLRFWEHEDADEVVAAVEAALSALDSAVVKKPGSR
jgi:DNA mismatch endonuclease (patch repair protein)